MDNIIIQPYNDQDWSKVTDVHDRARPIELEGSSDPKAFIPLAEDKHDLADFHSSDKYVALINGTIVGFVGIADQIISWLYVDPNYFRQGVGRALLEFALTNIDGNATTFVLNGNTSAIRLYESEGFHCVSEIKTDNNGYPCTVLKLAQNSSQDD